MKKASKKLIAQWDKKLKRAGFEDAENRDNGMLKKWHDPYWRLRFTPESFEERRRYFELASNWLNNGTFETGRHKTAWSHHCDGLSYRDIAKLMKTNYDVVMDLVQRCQREAGLRQHDND